MSDSIRGFLIGCTLLLALVCPLVVGASLPSWANAEVAPMYAKAALIEWSTLSHAPVNRNSLEQTPLVMAREGGGGVKVVQVVYPSGGGSYVVTFTVNRDGLLSVFHRGATIDTPQQLQARFEDPAFDPGTLVEVDPPH